MGGPALLRTSNKYFALVDVEQLSSAGDSNAWDISRYHVAAQFSHGRVMFTVFPGMSRVCRECLFMAQNGHRAFRKRCPLRAQSSHSLHLRQTAAKRTFRTFDQTEALKANGPFRTFVDQWSVAAQRPETCLSSISQHLDPRKNCNAGQSAQSVTYRIICNELTLQNVW
jgi:hypothetical protein